MLRRTISKIFDPNINKLGRWEHRNNKRTNDIKFILANKDNCGDNICGNPEPINKILKETNINPYSNSFTTKLLCKKR